MARKLAQNMILHVLLTLLILSCCPILNNSSDNVNSRLQGAEKKLIEDQRSLVAALTGGSEIATNVFIHRRWDREEKSLTREYLKQRFNIIGLVAREHHYSTNLPETNDMSRHNPYNGSNLFVELPATTTSDEYIIVGAHYDSVKESPGASDNASGCALVFGLAQLMSSLEVRTKNMIFVFFDQEETGHAGSYAFVELAQSKGLKIHSVHTADQVGWDQDGDRNIELELPTKELKSIYKKYTDLLGVKLYTTEVTSSDHKEWREAGYPAVGITEEYKHCDTSPHHHDPTDTFETVNFEYLAFVTFLVGQVLEELITI